MNSMTNTMDVTPPPPPRLNVIFHGPFLFIYYPTRIEVVTPDTPEHVAVAGTWLGEKLCRPGTLYLAGVPNQSATVNPNDPVAKNTHVIIKAQDVSINIEQGPYYRFVLPLPSSEDVLALTKKIDRTKTFVGSYANGLTADYFGTVHVLSYMKFTAPQLEGFQWSPQPSPYAHWECVTVDGNCVEEKVMEYNFATNLHIYAEAVYSPDPIHPVRDFKQMVAMLPGLVLGLAPFPTPDPEIDLENVEDEDDLGIIREEQGGLRGLPPNHPPFKPPVVCDAPSLIVAGAKDSS